MALGQYEFFTEEDLEIVHQVEGRGVTKKITEVEGKWYFR